MKNFDLNALGVEAMPKQEMQDIDGGVTLKDAVLALVQIVGEFLVECAVETHKRQTLMNMPQNSVKLWG